MSLEKIIFKEKRYSELLEEIYDNQKRKEKQISGLISELRPLIQDTGDATIIVPLIKEYMEIGVKNDDALIKLATIIQRIEIAQTKGDGNDLFDFDSLQSLLEETEEIQEEVETSSDKSEEKE